MEEGDCVIEEVRLPPSHEKHLAEFHAARKAGYAGSIYDWHMEKFGTFW